MLTVLLLAGALFCWGALSARLERADLTAPIVFVAVGFACRSWHRWNARRGGVAQDPHRGHPGLGAVLGRGAGGTGRAARGRRVYGRLLGVALPVTVVLGWASPPG